MSQESALVMPRRLAIVILHEAQVAQPESIAGWVEAEADQPARFVLEGGAEAPAAIWANLWSYPSAPAVPEPSQLHPDQLSLLVSLNTKGVLEMRAWELRDGKPFERVLKIRD